MKYTEAAIEKLVDPRQPSNATRYTLKDLVLGALTAFFMQSESFLEYQRQMKSRCGQDNAHNLFGITNIPTVEQIRNVLDGIKAQGLFKVFEWVYRALREQGYLKVYQTLGKNLLITLDGTQYYSSQKVSCPCCSSRTHKNGQVTYSHSALLPVIIAPNKEAVISLAPEFITPQDGSEKQDCEQNATKRWIIQHRELFSDQDVTLLGDDLYSNQPLCEHCLEHGFNFIFVCLPQSHTSLYEWLSFLESNGELKTIRQRRWNGRHFEIWHYRYLNRVPIREQQPALQVNWCEVKVTRESDGKQLYFNSWITNHHLTPQTVIEVVASGRGRWKTENENHNVLKTRGYHLEHNFGHGQRHLAKILLTLNLLAFLFHTVLQFVDERYQLARHQRGTRKGFFQDILSLTKYLLFESWHHLLDFMLGDAEPLIIPANTS
ncbi:MAG: ISNCY family transposase [Cyanobacteria bacterium P01_F01_bin.143]